MVEEYFRQIQDVARCLEHKLHPYRSLLASSAIALCKDINNDFRLNGALPLTQSDYINALLALARCREGIYILSLTANAFVQVLIFEGISTELIAISSDLDHHVKAAHSDSRLDYEQLLGKLLALKDRVTRVESIATKISQQLKLDAMDVARIRGWTHHEVALEFPYNEDIGNCGPDDNEVYKVIYSLLSIDDNGTIVEIIRGISADLQCTMAEISVCLGHKSTYMKGLKSNHSKKSRPFPGAVNSQVQLGRMPWKTSWGVR